jgi:hypothetical protein
VSGLPPTVNPTGDLRHRVYPGGCINPRTESLVVTCLLDEKRGITLKRLRRDLDDLPPEWIEESIESLEQAGVVFVSDTRIHGTPATQRLDDLEMICITGA